MFRIFVIALVSLCALVPFLVLFNRVLSIGNDLAGYVSIFLAWVVTPIVLLTIWKSKSGPSVELAEQDEDKTYDAMEYYPFSKAELPENEIVEWTGCNPTFHRGGEWGIILSNEALYYFSPFWGMLSKWKRYSLSSIENVKFNDSRRFPMLVLQIANKRVKLRTPYDPYKDEMEFDRKQL